MALLRDMKTVVINVHLGGAPSFDIRADESATATTAECRWSAHEAGPGARDFLVELLEKVRLAYASAPSAPLCTDGPKIRAQAECRP